jgi:4-alpha-glucanotransferase
MGDVPIFVAHDSADVWVNQELFHLDNRGLPTHVAGVPPDYFSATGQLWGNPLYRWDRMRSDGFAWWVRRLQHALRQFDLVRLDHFRGFEAYWEIPAQADTAAAGRWVAGPGSAFFRQLIDALGPLPLVAEDLGVITPAVDALRDGFGFPGMRILQFAFGDDPKSSEYRPHNFPRNCVVYTGTHDNDTTAGWFHSQAGDGTTRTAAQISRERETTLRYLGTDGHEIAWDLIRLALASVADTAIVPIQDILGLGTGARMNLPGTAVGNWRWRLRTGELRAESADRLRDLTTLYDRCPQAPAEMPPETPSRCS